jgi:hypothetical protein
MEFRKSTKEEQPELVAVLLRKDGSLVINNTIPLLIDKGYPCSILRHNTVKVTTGDLKYWLQQGGTPVYKGDELVLKL